MSEKYLLRDDAPFGDAVWEAIDNAVISAARSQLSARKLLHIEGPYGLGLKTVSGPDSEADEETAVEGATLTRSRATPVSLIQTRFTIKTRDVASYEANGLSLNLSPAVKAAVTCARQEDALIFEGGPDSSGLLNADGVQGMNLSSWDEPGAAADDLIKAVTQLDEAGFHGPYAVALAPGLYNALYRRYPQGNATVLEHVRTIVTDGVVKAPALGKGGVLIATGKQLASIVVGQDMMAGFIGPDGGVYEFSVSESVALKLRMPGSVCVLKQK